MARYAHIENNQITGVYDFLPENWRNISNFKALEDETEYINSLGWRRIIKNEPVYNPSTQYMGNPRYTLINDTVIEDIEIFDIPVVVASSPEPMASAPTIDNNSLHIMAMQQLRDKRDELLLKTDFTQLLDVSKINGTTITTAYETYRQQLRDLPDQYENDSEFIDVNTAVFPELITETTPPEETPPVETPPEETPPTDPGV